MENKPDFYYSKEYNLGACMKGNGTTVYNRAQEENGDYKNIAHISDTGNITYWEEDLPREVIKEIERLGDLTPDNFYKSNN